MSAPSAEPVSLENLNGLPAGLARERLLACCASARWAAEVASGRPFASVDEAVARSDESVAGLSQADLEQALAGHPRIGNRARSAGDGSAGEGAAAASPSSHAATEVLTAGWSRQEQAGLRGADGGTIQALADGNAAYERRFGHIYLVCATGRSAPELLAMLRRRLGNDPGTEWAVIRRELGKINQIRLRKLLQENVAGLERRRGAADASGGAQPHLSAVTTHVLDTARGVPAAGIQVWLEQVSESGRTEIARTRTGPDGRAAGLGPHRLAPGTYRLVFGAAGYFASQGAGSAVTGGRGAFFPEVAVTFTADTEDGEAARYHVPLLLSPFGFTVYRGS
jgi:hydroxyisourate hydrolase